MNHREIVFNPSDLPVMITAQKLTSVSTHWHSALEVVYVAEGKVTVKESNMYYHLAAGDIYVVNYNETHKIFTPGETAAVIFFHFDPEYFSRFFPDLMEISFSHYCFSKSYKIDDCIAACKHLLLDIYAELRVDAQKGCKAETLCISLISILVANFQYIYFERQNGKYQDSLSRDPGLSAEQMEMLHRITNYIYHHYNEKITLDGIAEKEFYNKFYVSHFFRKAYGLSFQEVVSMCKVEASEKLLLSTKKTIDEVASIVGFATRKLFCTQFKKWHGISPSEYRKQNAFGAPGNIDNYYNCEL